MSELYPPMLDGIGFNPPSGLVRPMKRPDPNDKQKPSSSPLASCLEKTVAEETRNFMFVSTGLAYDVFGSPRSNEWTRKLAAAAAEVTEAEVVAAAEVAALATAAAAMSVGSAAGAVAA
ncbi:hypothetical protein ACOSQ2_017524 [Xanthoceras sorbifolium]